MADEGRVTTITETAAEDTAEELANQPPEKLADRLEEETEKVGGRLSMVERFGVADVKFTKPLTWSGKTWESAHLDFTSLTGADMEAIDEEVAAYNRGKVPEDPAASKKYLRILAAKASGIPAMALPTLPAADYNAIVTAARYFLLASQVWSLA